MHSYFDIIQQSYRGYAEYFTREILNPHWGNYFYWLIGISCFVYCCELLFPWRKDQAWIRKDFWLDTFYLFFNFFLFSLIGYNALSNVGVQLFNDILHALTGWTNIVAIQVGNLPGWLQLIILFVVRDFIQWNIHRLLHRVPWMWQFHKVHHSVIEMGYAAHLRYHFMENIFYRTLEYIPLAMIGFGIQDFILVHLFALTIGHLNHANLRFPLGPLKYIFNNPQMHIWHHSKHLPPQHPYGVNFGISLSIWDYLFGKAYQPYEGRDIALGFPDVEQYPDDFLSQVKIPFKRNSNN